MLIHIRRKTGWKEHYFLKLGKIGREELALVPAPPGTATHKVIPHHEVINALVDTLSLRHIAPVREEYAVSNDGMKMFGIWSSKQRSKAAASPSVSETPMTNLCGSR